MYLLHTHERLDMKNIFEIFTTKLLLKKNSHVLKKNDFRPYLGQFLSDFKTLGTIIIGKARSLS